MSIIPSVWVLGLNGEEFFNRVGGFGAVAGSVDDTEGFKPGKSKMEEVVKDDAGQEGEGAKGEEGGKVETFQGADGDEVAVRVASSDVGARHSS